MGLKEDVNLLIDRLVCFRDTLNDPDLAKLSSDEGSSFNVKNSESSPKPSSGTMKNSTERPSVSPADESSPGDAIHSELFRLFEKLQARSILSDPVVRRYYNSLRTILGTPSLEMYQLDAKIGKLREFLSELEAAVAEEPLLLRVVAECQFNLCFCLLEAHHAESFIGRECFEPPAVDGDAFVEAEGLLSEAMEVSPDYRGGHMALVDIMLRKARLLSEAEAKESLDAFL